MLCQFPSETLKKYFLIEISNTLISNNSTACSVLLVSDWVSQVQSEQINICTYFLLVTSNIENTWRYQTEEKSFLIAIYFSALWNSTISLPVCLLTPVFGTKEMSLLFSVCFKTRGLEINTAHYCIQLSYRKNLLSNGFKFFVSMEVAKTLSHIIFVLLKLL